MAETLTVTPTVPTAGGSYHVDIVGLPKNRALSVDTSAYQAVPGDPSQGPWSVRLSFTSDRDGHVAYDATTGPVQEQGGYGIHVQDLHGHGLADAEFNVT